MDGLDYFDNVGTVGSTLRHHSPMPANQTGYVNGYPTMHYFGNPRHTQSMIAYKILTE
mgnify:CR=1 FL=1